MNLNTTSIDSLFDERNAEPSTAGKFLTETELLQIQQDLAFLIEENQKLSGIVEQFAQTSIAAPLTEGFSPLPNIVPTPSPTPQPTPPPPTPAPTPSHHHHHPSASPLPSPPQDPSPVRTPVSSSPYPVSGVSSSPQMTYSFSPAMWDSPNQGGDQGNGDKQMQIIMDANKLVYLLLFIVLMIIILKK